jgi:subtilisin family serine protease
MNLLRVRPWSVVVALLAVQAATTTTVASAATPSIKVDRRIKQIQASGSSPILQVLVRSDGTDPNGLFSALRTKGIKVRRQLLKGSMFAIDISASDLTWLESLSGVASVSIDATVNPAPLAAESVLSGGSVQLRTAKKPNALRALLGLGDSDPTGNGIGVAIIDSGIAPVTDLFGRITAFYDFTNGQNAVVSSPVDGFGHGTHIAGLIAGSGALSNGEFGGVAPNARLIGLRVLNNSGGGSTSDVIAAIEFAVSNRAALGIDVINISLGHPPYESATTDPMVRAV